MSNPAHHVVPLKYYVGTFISLLFLWNYMMGRVRHNQFILSNIIMEIKKSILNPLNANKDLPFLQV
jgi:hypothetical protein